MSGAEVRYRLRQLKAIAKTIEDKNALDLAIDAVWAKEVTGEWIEHKYAEEYDGLIHSNFECSECHDWLREQTNYCPNCGADMKGNREVRSNE